MSKQISNPTHLPFMLRPDPHIMNLMDLSRSGAFKLVNREDVPSIRVGKRILVPRDAFLDWLNQQMNAKN